MNEKFKLIFDNSGKTVTMTESHPKLDATTNDKGQAMNTVADMYGYTAKQIVLQSDTVVWQAANP